MIVIGIDPHKSTHTATAVDAATNTDLGSIRINASFDDYAQLMTWSKQWPDRIWAVENASGLGHHLTQWLISRGEAVVDLPSTATARVRELSRGGRRKKRSHRRGRRRVCRVQPGRLPAGRPGRTHRRVADTRRTPHRPGQTERPTRQPTPRRLAGTVPGRDRAELRHRGRRHTVQRAKTRDLSRRDAHENRTRDRRRPATNPLPDRRPHHPHQDRTRRLRHPATEDPRRRNRDRGPDPRPHRATPPDSSTRPPTPATPGLRPSRSPAQTSNAIGSRAAATAP